MTITASDLARFRAAKAAGQVAAPRPAVQSTEREWIRATAEAMGIMARHCTALQVAGGPAATSARILQHVYQLLADATELVAGGAAPAEVLTLTDHRLAELTAYLTTLSPIPAPEAPTMPTPTPTELERRWRHVCGGSTPDATPTPGEMLAQLRAWVRRDHPELVAQVAAARAAA
ncbi:hypothetical protein [Deinococcus petrolearius]|uniref:Uncharacterized protein n=1 Tax=Deinococcus petrolearius TaxID=1751295 RepID=A0ABW1DGA0_9DEIO